jgi:hypothetical protein
MTTAAASKPNRSFKLLALLHCSGATPGERASARLRLLEIGVICKCSLCEPQPKSAPSDYYDRCKQRGIEPSDYFKRQETRIKYRAERPESVAWASEVARDIRTKHGPLEIDDFGMSVDAILEKYPSPHADRVILTGELEQHRMKVSGGWVEISRSVC